MKSTQSAQYARPLAAARPAARSKAGRHAPGIAASALFAAALLFSAARGVAQTPGASAEDILRKLEENQAFDTSRIEARLSVMNRFGTTENGFTAWARRGGDALLEITSGPDRGQKVLRQKDNIYLYYPEADEVIWLRGTALRDSLMGSDFSYQDLTDDKTLLSRFTPELLGTETIDGAECWHLLLVAKTRAETYARQEIWVDKALSATRKAILYSAAGKALREMRASDFRTVADSTLPFTVVMSDLLKKNTSTTMTILKAEIHIPIGERYFNREELSW